MFTSLAVQYEVLWRTCLKEFSINPPQCGHSTNWIRLSVVPGSIQDYWHGPRVGFDIVKRPTIERLRCIILITRMIVVILITARMGMLHYRGLRGMYVKFSIRDVKPWHKNVARCNNESPLIISLSILIRLLLTRMLAFWCFFLFVNSYVVVVLTLRNPESNGIPLSVNDDEPPERQLSRIVVGSSLISSSNNFTTETAKTIVPSFIVDYLGQSVDQSCPVCKSREDCTILKTWTTIWCSADSHSIISTALYGNKTPFHNGGPADVLYPAST